MNVGVLVFSHVRLLAVIAIIMRQGAKSIIVKNMKTRGQVPEQLVTVSSQNTSKNPASADDDLSSRKGVFPQRGGNANSGILATFKDRKMSHRPRHEIIYGASSGCLVDSESCTDKGKTSLPYK